MALQAHETRSDNDEISVVQELSNIEAGVGESCTIEEHHTTTEDLIVLEIPSAQCATGIATGNWGCGAFGGDVELKSMLQWIAASQVLNWVYYCVHVYSSIVLHFNIVPKQGLSLLLPWQT
jgi:hypothetical protein